MYLATRSLYVELRKAIAEDDESKFEDQESKKAIAEVDESKFEDQESMKAIAEDASRSLKIESISYRGRR
jgi:hypothetical protein